MGLLNVGRKIGGLFGGMDDPRLDPVQNKMAQKQAMLQAGISMLGGQGNFGQMLAQGLSAGQNAGMQGRQELIQQGALRAQQKRREELSALVRGGRHKEAVELAIAEGDIGAASNIVGLMKQMEPDPVEWRPLGDGSGRLYNPVTKEITGDPKAPEVKAPVYGTPEYLAAFEALEKIKSKYDKPSGGGGTRAPRTLTEGERKATAFGGFIPDHVDFLKRFTSSPGRVQQLVSNKGLGEFASEEQQQLDIAATAVTEAWLRLTTGGSYNQQEYKNAERMFKPLPGDKLSTVKMKQKNLDRLIQMLGVSAGAGGVTRGSAIDPFGDL